MISTDKTPASWIRTCEHWEVIESTNLRARELISQACPLPALVVADEQTGGRGRGGNWWSPPGSLLLTLAFRSQWLAGTESLVSLAIGVCVAETVNEFFPDTDVRVKWPNDVMIHDRKLSGILIERLENSGTATMQAGIGVNVANDFSAASAELRQSSISLGQLPGPTPSRDDFLRSLLQRLLDHVVAGTDKEMILAGFRRRCWLAGHNVRVGSGGNALEGKCLGVDDHGWLLVQCSGEVQRLVSGTVRRIPAADGQMD